MIEYNDERHEYKIDGVIVPSVTQVIAPLSPDFSFVDAEVMERASNFGRAVHAACEQDDNGDLDENALDENLVPRLVAWRLFKKECGVVIDSNEEIVFSRKHRVAGRLDRRVKIDRKEAIVDIKTCTSLHDVVGVQLAGYEYCVSHMIGYSRQMRLRIAVQLKENGNYTLKIYKEPDDLAAFLNCLKKFEADQNLEIWRRNHGH